MKARLLSVIVLISLLLVSLASRGVGDEPALVTDDLGALATAQGTVRVVVRVNAPFRPEGQLASPAHVASQRLMLAGVQSTVRGQLRGTPHRVVRDFDGRLPLMAIEVSPDALRMLASLRGLVAEIQADELAAPTLVQSTPLINADAMWNAELDGAGQVIAVLDTGVQRSHPFFGGRVIGEACFSSNSGDGTSVCPGGVETSFAAGSARPCPLPGTDCDHGTHVAGIAAGASAPFSGVARGAGILAIQVFTRFPASFPLCNGVACMLSFSTDQMAALNYVNARRQLLPGRRIAAVNMSLGAGAHTATCPGDPRAPLIDQLLTPHPTDPTDRGVATVIAAGNDGFTAAIAAPACNPAAIPVASSTKADEASSFTNIASPALFPNIVFAPGTSIHSAIPTSTFASFSGTSMAAPHVAGALAVLRQLAPTATVAELLDQLKATGVPILDTDAGVTAPRVDLLAAAQEVNPGNLVVQTLSAPAVGFPGTSLSVTTSIRNTGIGGAGPSSVAIYLSSDNVITTGDTLLGTIAVEALDGGTTSPVATLEVELPQATTPGAYFIGAIADAHGQVDESNEADNTKAVAITLVLPDLAVTRISATPATVAAGQTVRVVHTVKNVAAAPAHAPASTSGMYLSGDAAFGDAVSLGTVAVRALTAGASASVKQTLQVPGNTSAGQYWIFAAANDTAAFAEAASANNRLGSAAPILVGPDLVVTAATSAPRSAAPGTTVSVRSTVKNQGAAPAGPFEVGIYLSRDNATFEEGVDVLLATRPVAGLAAGRVSTAATPVTMPGNVSAGTYYLIVLADSAHAVPEAIESNNTRATASTQVVRADLTVLSVTAPAVAAPGTTVSVSHTVKNLAKSAGAAPGSTSRLYLSDTAELGGGDAAVLADVAVGPLAGGATRSVKASVQIPPGTEPGPYWIIAQANATNTVPEADSPTQANNAKAAPSPILVGPDLVVTSATAAPRATAPGNTVTVTQKLKNQGGLAAGPFDIGVYLSEDGTLDSGDELLTTGSVPAGLAPGKTVSEALSVTMPSNLSAGTYHLIVRADSAGTPGAVVEANEGNNTRATASLQVIRPDLTVLSVTAPAVTGPGMNVSVKHVVRNLAKAAGSAQPTTTRLYLSDSPTDVAGQRQLGDVPVPLLAGGATRTVTASVQIPGDTPAGQYWIVAQANATNAVAEADAPIQANNVKATAAQTAVGADLIVTAATAAPRNTTPGMTVKLTTAVRNQGGAAAGPFDVGIYLSADDEIDPGDTLLTTGSVPAGLLPGARVSLALGVPMPSNVSAGTYLLIVRADVNGDVADANAANNTRATAAIRLVRTDLTVKTTVKNQGGQTAPGSVVRFSLTASGELDGNEIPVGMASTPSLAPGAFVTMSTGSDVQPAALTSMPITPPIGSPARAVGRRSGHTDRRTSDQRSGRARRHRGPVRG